MNNSSPSPAQTTGLRDFAVQVVTKLTAAGHRALWAGGCVRDQLRGVTPKDYDVATSARPDQIQALFGRRHTLAVGKQFGVIVVLSPNREQIIEVATFRRDLEYLDGRHPKGIEYASPEEDAQRRDFTVNGLFFDPLADQVIDYVGGQADLQRKTIRAIGVPHDRFAEDKLRMMRAVRFCTLLDFSIEPLTARAISELGSQLIEVSAERVAGELRLILASERRAVGVALLETLGLLSIILPELAAIALQPEPWSETLDSLAALTGDEHLVEIALALLFLRSAGTPSQTERKFADAARRIRLANREFRLVTWLLRHFQQFATAAEQPWPTIQRLLVSGNAPAMLSAQRACTSRHADTQRAIEFCEQKLQLPPEQLDPAPLLTGDDLIRLGIPRGAVYSRILTEVRDAQLLGEVQNQQQAVTLARTIFAREGGC